MVGMVCVEGTGNHAGYPGYPTFMQALNAKFPMSAYLFNTSPAQTQAGVESAVKAQLALPGSQGVILAAYGTAATPVISAARNLSAANITIDCLALFDGLKLDWWSSIVPPNVKMTYHARRLAILSGSLTQWSNCGTLSLTGFKERFYIITHRGVSGIDYLMNPKGPSNPQDRVWEDQIPHNFQAPTFLTYQQDWQAAGRLWNWMYSNIMAAAQAILAKPVQPQPGQPQPQPQPAPVLPAPTTHVVIRGESLSIIAGKFWGDVLLWPLLHKANLAKVPNPNLIQPGLPLIVPDISGLSPSQLNQARQQGRHWH